ncbi:hypothetical protein BC826DRAFT_971919 [Russula brevipes]|nr:hypothetical protein BC826DRAFT_971919 [Russula brevipes]
MSQNPPESTSNSNYDLIFENALKAYKKKTGKQLTSDPLLRRLESCNSPDTVLGAIREHIPGFGQSGTRDDPLMNWLNPTVNVLLNFSETIGGTVSLAYPPASLIFTGIGSLLSAVQAVSASQDAMINLFERIENFFRRLEAYIGLTRTAGMMEIIVNVMVEVLIILSLATKELKQWRIKRFLKKLIGRSEIEDALQRLDNLAQEESRMAAAQGLKGVDSVNNKLGELQEAAIDQKRKQLRQDLENWLSPPDPTINYNIASDAHHQGTAKWFTNSILFEDWNASGCFMWIHGKPGSGKSVLSSAIIQDIRNTRPGLLAFFFCDFKDTAKQNIRALLSSLVVQLSYQSDSFYKILHDFYSTHRDGSQQPSVGALTQCLEDMLKVPGETPIYLIIDALDECPGTSGIKSPREEVLELVTALVELHISRLRLCVTSRPEIDIRAILEPLTPTSNRISLHDQKGQRKDIVNYVSSVVHQDIKMKKWRENDKRQVIESLSERADGILKYYVTAFRQDIPKANHAHAHRLLQCLTVAIRPLTVDELAEVLAIDFNPKAGGTPKLKEDYRLGDQEQAVLSVCSSLISIVEYWGSRRVQFSHFSVKEFLTSDRLTDSMASRFFHISPEPAHTIMAQACLGVLLRVDDKMDDETIRSYPLAEYAGQHFTDHADFENLRMNQVPIRRSRALVTQTLIQISQGTNISRWGLPRYIAFWDFNTSLWYNASFRSDRKTYRYSARA